MADRPGSREALASKKQDRIDKVRAKSGQNKESQGKVKARSIPVQNEIRSSS